MVDSNSFNLQPNFPVASIAELYANRPVKEAAIRAQQQQQLVQGLQTFGQGVDSIANRRIQMAQALAAAHLFSGTPSGQEVLGTNQVSTAGQMPVIKNQTASYDATTGSVTPNKGSATMGDLQTVMMGVEPKDFLANMTAQKQLSFEPQKLAIEARKAAAEEENNKIQRLIQGMLANNTIQNQAKERQQAQENAQLDANKEASKHWFLHPFKARAASDAIADAGSMKTEALALPSIGKTITHSSGVKIKRLK